MKQVHTLTATSILTTKSTHRSLSVQRLSKQTAYVLPVGSPTEHKHEGRKMKHILSAHTYFDMSECWFFDFKNLCTYFTYIPAHPTKGTNGNFTQMSLITIHNYYIYNLWFCSTPSLTWF
jgi:hypothetical protein